MKDYGVGCGRKNRLAKLAAKIAWNDAIRQDRAVRIKAGSDISMKAYPDAQAAQVAVAAALALGFEANVIPANLALSYLTYGE